MKMDESNRGVRKMQSSKRKGIGITVKLVFAIVVSVMIAVSALLFVVNNRMSKNLLAKSEEMLHMTTEKTLQQTKAWMNQTLAMLKTQRDTIEYEGMDIPEMLEYIKHTAGQSDAYPAGLYVALTDGALYHASFVPGPEFNALVKSWYVDGLESEDFILGDVYFDEDSQSYVVGASGVLKDKNGNTLGVAAADVYLDSISDIVKDTKIEDTGSIFLVDKRTDTIIGHAKEDLVGEKLSEAGGMYAYIGQRIQAGDTGLSLYKNTYVETADIEGCDWAAVAYVSKKEVLSELSRLTQIMMSMSGGAVLFMILLVTIQIRRIIGRPVKEISKAATRIAQGDLDQTISYRSGDELGVLADDFNRVTLRLRDYIKYINEISDTLREIAKGNLAFELKNEYSGEFLKIKESFDEIGVELNLIVGQLNAASKDVAAGSALVSDSTVSLSQGSTEQAAQVETLADTMGKVSVHIQEIASGAQEASDISKEVQEGLLESNEKMRNMTEVIQKISEKSNAIHKIVKTIDDIAFQTNILALNAAVEASRAGEAGKGFAVVAEEVRTLAGKSADAARETTQLLGETIESMEEGVDAAQDTAGSMLAVAGLAEKMNGLIGEIAENTKRQSKAAKEITNGIDQISIVVQNNVNTAESSAAASEELSSQADALREMVSGFRLKNQGRSS